VTRSLPKAYSSYLAEFDKRDVHRAAATFWVWECEAARTTIEFLNYWKIKRRIDSCTLRVTLRDVGGATMAQDTRMLRVASGVTIAAREILNRASRSLLFEGSLEVEVFCDEPIGFAYPALLALYTGPDSQALVHTYARTYAYASGDADNLITNAFRAEESNWTVRDSDRYRSFLVIHNGEHALPAETMMLQGFNAEGDMLRIDVPLPARAPYATTRVLPSAYADVAAFLGGYPGWMIASFTTRGVLPRLLAGHMRASDGALFSLTHSHHDSRTPAEWMSPARPVSKPMYISFAQGTPWTTRVNAYPTHPAGEFDLRRIDYRDGQASRSKLVRHLNAQRGVSDMRCTVVELPTLNGCAVSDLVLDTAETQWPTRMHLGVEFATDHEMPASFTTGFASFRKPRYATWWLPILNLAGRDDTFVLLNTDVDDAPPPCPLAATLYRQSDEQTLEAELIVPSNGVLTSGPETLFPGAGRFLGDERGWIAFRNPERANLHVYYATIDRRSGCIAADHAF